MKRAPFEFQGELIPAGQQAVVPLEMPSLSSQTHLEMPVHIIHGRKPGPTLFLSAAVHGDELNGIEIIRSVLATKRVARLKGTLLAVPVVNGYGLINESRYMPDRRDLNRCFPGSERGSLGGRLAHLFMEEIVGRSTHGIDLHTGSNHRTNLPQIRANLDDPETLRLANAFGVPVLLNSGLRPGSMRGAAGEKGVPVLLYEAGEALRYNEMAIRAGVTGVISVMRALEMLPRLKASTKPAKNPRPEPFIARGSRWDRAPEGGMLRARVKLGAQVTKGDILAYVVDPGGGDRIPVRARAAGIVIGRLELPKVNEGDAVYHIANFDDLDDVADHVDDFHSDYTDPDLYDS